AHTRFSLDWSSDVCSSDLAGVGLVGTGLHQHQPRLAVSLLWSKVAGTGPGAGGGTAGGLAPVVAAGAGGVRDAAAGGAGGPVAEDRKSVVLRVSVVRIVCF